MSRGVLPDRVDEGGLLLVGPQSKNCIYHAVTNSDGVCEVFGNPGEGYVYALDSNDWHVVEAVAHDAEGVMQPPTTATMPGALDLVVAEVAMLAVQSTREKLLGLQWAPTDTETFKPVMLPGDLTSRVERQAARLCPDAVCLVGLREMFADTITVKAILATRGIIEMQVRPLRPSDFKEPYDIALGRDVECDKGRLILHFASPEKRAGALQRIPVAVGSSHKVPLLLETGVEYCLPVGRYVVCPEMTMAADAAKVDIKSGQLSDVFLQIPVPIRRCRLLLNAGGVTPRWAIVRISGQKYHWGGLLQSFDDVVLPMEPIGIEIETYGYKGRTSIDVGEETRSVAIELQPDGR
jgi:hypothetical protein